MADKKYWQPAIPISQGIYEESATQLAELGTRLEVGDRVFYYMSAGEALTATYPLVAATETAGHTNEIITSLSHAAAATKITVSNSLSIAAGTYNDGYLCILSQTGGMYRIKSQYVFNSNTNFIELYDPITYSCASNGTYSLIRPLYKLVLNANSAVTQLLVGVAPINITNAYYFWGQTWGPACVASEAAVIGGLVYTLGTADADKLTIAEAVSLLSNGPTAGVGLAAGGASYNGPIFLTIRP